MENKAERGGTEASSAASSRSPVKIAISDALGRELRRPLDAVHFAPGKHGIQFDARGLPPGLYHCTLSDGRRTERRSMVLLP